MDQEVMAGPKDTKIRRKTRRRYSAEEKIRVVLRGLRGETSIAALCRREGIPSNLYYRWSKEFVEGGKGRLKGNTARQQPSAELTELLRENQQLKQLAAELLLKNRVLQKDVIGLSSDEVDH